MRSLPLYLSFFVPALTGINWDIYEHGVVPSFKWSRPFPDDGTDPGGFEVHCKAKKTFRAKMYKLSDLPEDPPTGLSPWRHAIEDFMDHTKEFMGSWDGVDHKGENREIVVMEYKDVPLEVREWIEQQQRDEETEKPNKKKWWFGVFEKPQEHGQRIIGTVKPTPTPVPQGGHAPDVKDIKLEDKILVFPGGAIYEILPLWVAGGSGACERELNNLPKYKHQAIDHCVIAWVTDHTKPQRENGKRDMEFTIEAMAVTESEDGKRSRLMWERLHRTIKRNDRKQQREERQKKKKELEEGIVRDEL
ncbi:hypothetical protein QC763_611320 [Podospora pseudopauciseta]|uniref:Uncharacterized protein n=1 Tax=Podospora pseudopauciseta TaxID=2093780 RepID=A0ABR0H3C2_9PEZI|nr:hypothetical protein QC763_611320 [Podospora pseudopauciseta]